MRNTGLFLILFLLMPLSVSANDYPTLERVDYVLTCMKKHGGQNIDNLYGCSCEIDIIASKVAFDDFAEANTFAIYKRMPGEKGGIFRDSERGEQITSVMEEAQKDADKRCFVGAREKSSAETTNE